MKEWIHRNIKHGISKLNKKQVVVEFIYSMNSYNTWIQINTENKYDWPAVVSMNHTSGYIANNLIISSVAIKTIKQNLTLIIQSKIFSHTLQVVIDLFLDIPT